MIVVPDASVLLKWEARSFPEMLLPAPSAGQLGDSRHLRDWSPGRDSGGALSGRCGPPPLSGSGRVLVAPAVRRCGQRSEGRSKFRCQAVAECSSGPRRAGFERRHYRALAVPIHTGRF